MKFEWGYLFGMALQTVPEPRKIAREVLSQGYPRLVLWQVLALLLVALTWLGVISGILFPIDAADYGPLFSNPLMVGMTESSIAVLTVFAIYWIGRAAGGTGRFEQAILTVIWLQFITLIIELGVVFLGVFAPALALLLWIMGLVMTFWILSHFIAEMHGFSSAGKVFGGIVMTLVVMVVVMSIVATLVSVGAGETGAI